ncbi:MAG: SDR family NAD(P)-dependent oxidoreductase [Pseudomonadota bacterium]|nr:SDR family NAD(P)-dependent oxidoreductase [Pseudomonadota bacterium]
MARRTPPETLHYPDLVASLPEQTGRVVAITGCTSGMGLVLAKTAAGKGAQVVMLNRPSDRADRALDEVKGIAPDAVLIPCDLASFTSVRAAGAAMREQFGATGVDVLVNNAGLMGLPEQGTEDGFDIQMQANHLSHFLLTHEIWPLLETAAAQRGEARVVNHSSGARNRPKRPVMREMYEADPTKWRGDRWPGMGKWLRYSQSKLANLLFTYALQEHADARPGNKVKALCAHPGPADSGLQAKTTKAGKTTILDRYILSSTVKVAQSQEDGTCGLARAAFEPEATGGDFYGPDAEKRVGPALRLAPERDPQGEAILWEASLKATGITDFFS